MNKKQAYKSPAFQFYAQDWLSDFKVRCLTYEQKGIYIELLAMSWIEPLTSDLNRLAIAMQLQPDSIAIIIDQFFYKEGDFFYNKKLEKYRAEKIKFIKDKKRAGKEGAEKRWNKTKKEAKQTHSTPIADPMANDSSSSSTSSLSSTSTNKHMSESDFNSFWNQYPNKKGKVEARKKFLNLNKDLLPVILDSLEKYKMSPQWVKDGGRFIPHGSTWINQQRWEDELEVEVGDEQTIWVGDVELTMTRYNKLKSEGKIKVENGQFKILT